MVCKVSYETQKQCVQQRNFGFVGFLGKVEPKWCRKHPENDCVVTFS